MPARSRGAAVAPPPHIDPLAEDGASLEHDLDYFSVLKRAGAFRRGGQIYHSLPTGTPYRRNGRWLQNTKTFPVAMSAEEAREQTRQTGERWDYFEAGAKCKRCAETSGDALISGWVLGGRKFQNEHNHVTEFDPEVYGTVEVAAPGADDEDMVADEAPVLVEA